ncbi:MAG TPA: Uma2 family endonuclease, partial [Pseudonocardiaceae bacterium]|nr:Uma2 family endonuclease [Pseudonocardiaceae bacterium]
DEHRRCELQEGNLVMSPSPAPDHVYAMGELYVQLRAQVPGHLEVLQDVDVDLCLAAADLPGFVRRPDLVVVEKSARTRTRNGGLIRASEVWVVIEIVSPGSRRLDHVIKHVEYADAGIRYYWIVDIEPPVSLLPYHLAEAFGYIDDGLVTGSFKTGVPFPVDLDLTRLR